jgi:hypothetical protein
MCAVVASRTIRKHEAMDNDGHCKLVTMQLENQLQALLATCLRLVYCFAWSSTMKMGATCSSYNADYTALHNRAE